MGRKLGKYSRLFFKLFLFMQLYCYHNLEVDAVPSLRQNLKTCDEHHNHTEKNLQRTKRPARMIPGLYLIKKQKNGAVKDIRFYGPASSCIEISKLGYTLNGFYLVKDKNQARKNQVEVLGCQFKHPGGTKKAKEQRIGFINIEITKSVKRRSPEPFAKMNREGIEDVYDKPKRPARLLPLRMILGKPKNNTENETEKQFYGPATTCEELRKLGYTLNGLYLVDCKDKSKKGIQIEVIECIFKQPLGSKEAKEERIGIINIEAKKIKTVQRRQLNALKETSWASVRGSRNRKIIQRPARLLPPHILYGKEKNDTEVVERFYGPPNNCSELNKLGYTLNGYYLVSGSASSHHIEFSLCKFGATESFEEERFVPKRLKYLPLNLGRNESYLLINLESGKCLDLLTTVLTQTDCNPSTTRRWKLFNDGKQLCVINSANCVSITVVYDGGNHEPMLSVRPLTGGENEMNFFDMIKTTHHVSVENNQIRFIEGKQMKNNSSYCMAPLSGVPADSFLFPVVVRFCNDNHKNQTWSFVSFE